MTYQPRKEWKDYEKMCEGLVIKLGTSPKGSLNRLLPEEEVLLTANRTSVRTLAELFAEEYNKGYSDSIIAMGEMKR